MILSKRGFSASKARFVWTEICFLAVLNCTNTIYYSNVYVSLQLSDVRYQNKSQNSFSSKMSIRCSRASQLLVWEGIVGYFHFRATVQCPLVPQTFWTGEIQLALFYFLRFQTVIHGWHDNCVIFSPSVFRYYIFFWIFFSATTISEWLMELVFLINPVRLGKLVVLSRNAV